MKRFYFTENSEQVRKDLYNSTSCYFGINKEKSLSDWNKCLVGEALSLDYAYSVFGYIDETGVIGYGRAIFYNKEGGIYLDNEAFVDKAKKLYPKLVNTVFDGEVIYYIDGKGNICCTVYDSSFETAFNMGNIFKTYDEAQKELDFRLALNTVNTEIKKLNNGWTPDWNNSETKYVMVELHSIIKIQGYMGTNYNSKLLPLSSQLNAEYIVENYAQELEVIFSHND